MVRGLPCSIALLLLGSAAAAAPAQEKACEAEGGNGTAKCNEAKFQGLCYRTCTDMGQMEPRKSPSNCGGVEDYSFLQRCNEDGSSSGGAGSAPGISGRPPMGCFGDTSASFPSPDAPNMCTTDCQKGAPSAEAKGCQSKFCCADGKSTPQPLVDGKAVICSCSR